MRFEPTVQLSNEATGSPGRWFVFNERGELLLVDNTKAAADSSSGQDQPSDQPSGQPPAKALAPVVENWSTGIDDKHLLGIDHSNNGESVPVWAARCSADFTKPDNMHFIGLRESFAVMDEADWIMAGRASQILAWADTHKFCGRCGTPTEARRSERAKQCPQCQLMAFPRLTPAVIMLVEREDGRALLAWGRQFPGRFYSALAGFVEPGESLEQAVVREVGEETGVEIDNIRYFGSQPWPFPNSLMIGFNANYVSGELQLQESEIVDADWFSPNDLPPVPQGRMSIAAWLIDDWIQRSNS